MTKIPQIFLGAVINLVLVALPFLFFAEIRDLFWDRRVWLFLGLLTLFCVIESYSSFTVALQTTVKSSRTILPYLSGISLLMLNWSAVAGSNSGFMSGPLAIVGTLFTITGIGLRYIAIRSLSQFFTSHVAVIRQHRLITEGIYGRIRHPSELGLILISVGVAMLLNSTPALLLAMGLMLPLSFYRIHREDQLLEQIFPQAFMRYRQSVPALWVRLNSVKLC